MTSVQASAAVRRKSALFRRRRRSVRPISGSAGNGPCGGDTDVRWKGSQNGKARLAEPETENAAGSFVPRAGRIRPTALRLGNRFPRTQGLEGSGPSGENWPMILRNMRRADNIYSDLARAEGAEVLARCCLRLDVIQST